MYRLNLEIYPFATKGLSPRHHVSQHTFKKIRLGKISESGGKCQTCEKKRGRMELHEAGEIIDSRYVFKGFHLLCQPCHDAVHSIQFGYMNRLGPGKFSLDHVWNRQCEMRKHGRFKSRSEFGRHACKVFDEAFKFMMADQVSCDYSAAAEYGLNPRDLERSFGMRYNHFSCRIRYVLECLRFSPDMEKSEAYEMYSDPQKALIHQSMLHEEYVRHKHFYDTNATVFVKASHEREKAILDYAETMKTSLIH